MGVIFYPERLATTVLTCESVCAGHPDKLCDQIADQILDYIIRQDKNVRTVVEVMATERKIIVAGEITTTSRLHICQSVRTVLNRADLKPRRRLIYVWVTKQSLDISAGVTTSLEAREGDTSTYADLGAGDQGTVYGYATDETRERLPLPLVGLMGSAAASTSSHGRFY